MDEMNIDKHISILGHNIGEPWFTILSIAVTILIGLILLQIIILITKHILKKSALDSMIVSFFVTVIRVAGIIVIIAICLDALGVSTGTIVAVLGAAGAAIALALKDSLANVAGGIMIVITQPFKQGDLINVGEYRGRVQKIDLFLTTLRTLNYRTITVPNGIMNTSILVNESREERRRVDLEFGISYDSDIEKAKDIMRKVCESSPLILKDPAPGVGVRRNDDSAVVLDLMAWCATDDYFSAEYYLKEEVKKAFDGEGINIPFPQIDVHVREK